MWFCAVLLFFFGEPPNSLFFYSSGDYIPFFFELHFRPVPLSFDSCIVTLYVKKMQEFFIAFVNVYGIVMVSVELYYIFIIAE